jgi:ABC-type lipoprotein release transport system permease subunit
MTKNPHIQRNPKTEDRKGLFGPGCFGSAAFKWRPFCRHLLAGLRYYRRSHFGVLLGTLLAAAVLTGSLLVGDSVDGSLRKAALQRLGSIEYALYTPGRFFSAGLADRNPGTVAALQLRGIALFQGLEAGSNDGGIKQINRVQVLGVSSNAWKFCDRNFQCLENEVLLGKKLASALGADAGDEISLRIEKPGLLPGDAPLASQKEDRTVRARLRVARILGDDELGRFSLSANQQAPFNAFVNLRWLQDRVGLDGKANLLVSAETTPFKVWFPSDFGYSFRQEGGVTQLESDRVYLDSEAVRAARTVPGAQGSLTYLVNSIAGEKKSTPYSFVVANEVSGLGDDEIILSRWLADELGAAPGDPVEVAYYELTASSQFQEKTRRFSVDHIVEMADLKAELELAPQFPGLSDVDRCADWDVGIPMDEAELEDESNEAYWEEYGQTPKAIVSLAAGQEMWSNRFGALTSVRWNVGQASSLSASAKSRTTVDRLEACPSLLFQNEYNPAAAGFVVQPVREQALAAVNHAMDFGGLFVGMSFFLIVASLMLTGLLFVFGIQQRAQETGILLATGWKPRRVRSLLLAEGGLVALAGSAGGALLGIGYTRLLLAGLSGQWKGAVAGSAIELFAAPRTVLTGAAASFLCALAAMAIAIWRQVKHPARELLVADFQSLDVGSAEFSNHWKIGSWLTLLGAVAIVVYAQVGDVQSVTMPFFGAGALLLISGILFCGSAFRRVGRQECLPRVWGLALRNVARRRGRSLAVIGLLACGCFLVFAVSSMKEDVAAHAEDPGSGTGGFPFFGESTLPIPDDLGGVRLRVRDGDDASCLNLNRAQSPRLLGVDPDAMSARRAFLAEEDVWQLLKQDLPGGAVPALAGDADTLMWGLEKKVGDRLSVRDERGRAFDVEIVGRLPMRLSVFQGSLLIDEQEFTERFPSEEGWRMFLLDERVENRRYERAGLDVVASVERLLEFYAVESTYLAMFLVLGALGLAVGSMGMGVVVLRNVQDRRAEIALLRAVGYRGSVLSRLLFMEHGLLLAAGLGVGVAASAVAMVPALVLSQSQLSAGFLLMLLLGVAACGAACMAAAVFASLHRAQILPDPAD